jgi:hypothetical protein
MYVFWMAIAMAAPSAVTHMQWLRVLQVLIEAGITKDMLDHSSTTPLLQAYKHQEFCERADTCKYHEMVQVGQSCDR